MAGVGILLFHPFINCVSLNPSQMLTICVDIRWLNVYTIWLNFVHLMWTHTTPHLLIFKSCGRRQQCHKIYLFPPIYRLLIYIPKVCYIWWGKHRKNTLGAYNSILMLKDFQAGLWSRSWKETWLEEIMTNNNLKYSTNTNRIIWSGQCSK